MNIASFVRVGGTLALLTLAACGASARSVGSERGRGRCDAVSLGAPVVRKDQHPVDAHSLIGAFRELPVPHHAGDAPSSRTQRASLETSKSRPHTACQCATDQPANARSDTMRDPSERRW